MISHPLKILVLEDNAADAEMIHHLLKKNDYNFESKVMMTREAYIQALDEFKPDIILSDNDMPQFSASEALDILHERFLHIPFILVTGTVSEEFAAGIIKAGADDYLLKDRLTRLPAAIDAALKQRGIEKEKQEAEQKIIQSETNLRTIFDNTSEGFVLMDRHGIVKALNSRAGQYSFFSKEKDIQVGESIYNFIEEERKDSFKVIMQKVINGNSVQYDRSYETENGDTKWLDFSVTPVSEGGEIEGICITGRDITERKKAERELNKNFIEKHAMAKRMSTILNTLPANIALLDAEGTIVEVNDAWRNFADDNGFIGSNHGIGDNYIAISKLSSGEDNADGKAVARGIKAVIDNKLKEFVLEYPCDSPKIERWFRMVITPLHDREYTGAVVMHVDISELRRLEQERLKSKSEEQQRITRAMLQGQERERNAIGIELHDNVNQILVGTNLILRLIKDSPDKIGKFIPSCIDNIKKAIGENRKIAHELVTPRIDAESFEGLISRLIQTMLVVTGIEATFLHENFREELLSDEQKLAAYRVAQEQCTNIVKYAKATNVVITLAIADGHFNMVIADNGIGMDSSSKPQGIGLKNIIGRLNVLNGDVSIISASGEGFRLEITMPLNTTTDTSFSSDVSEIKH